MAMNTRWSPPVAWHNHACGVVEQAPGRGWARHVRTLKETIRVYADAQGVLRADHELSIWGARFLGLHYRMRPRAAA